MLEGVEEREQGEPGWLLRDERKLKRTNGALDKTVPALSLFPSLSRIFSSLLYFAGLSDQHATQTSRPLIFH